MHFRGHLSPGPGFTAFLCEFCWICGHLAFVYLYVCADLSNIEKTWREKRKKRKVEVAKMNVQINLSREVRKNETQKTRKRKNWMEKESEKRKERCKRGRKGESGGIGEARKSRDWKHVKKMVEKWKKRKKEKHKGREKSGKGRNGEKKREKSWKKPENLQNR